ncbi:MAG: hypothetical protein EOP04_04635 [Proteobacteria bacterium]|nr:MAG: hypothetical protein EOP04_04635 [Pseudomonadota bacterium]
MTQFRAMFDLNSSLTCNFFLNKDSRCLTKRARLLFKKPGKLATQIARNYGVGVGPPGGVGTGPGVGAGTGPPGAGVGCGVGPVDDGFSVGVFVISVGDVTEPAGDVGWAAGRVPVEVGTGARNIVLT